MSKNPFQSVTIDGIEYVPKDTVFPKRAEEIIRLVDAKIWTEGHYDPVNDLAGSIFRELYEKTTELNELLRFRR